MTQCSDDAAKPNNGDGYFCKIQKETFTSH